MDHLFSIMVQYLALILHEFPILTFKARQHNQPWDLNTQNLGLEGGVSSYRHLWLFYRMTVCLPILMLDGSQPLSMPSWGDLMPSSGFHRHLHSHTRVHIHPHTWPIRSKMNLQIYTQYISRFLWGVLLIYVVLIFFFYIAFFTAHTIIFTHIMISRLPRVHQSILWNYISCSNQILYGLLSVYTANKIVFFI